MIIKEVETKKEISICDELLTKLIDDEKKYNDNIIDNIKINNYYENIYNKDKNALFVAVINNDVVGYIFIKVNVSNDKIEKVNESYIDALYVKEEYRNKGVGSLLIKKAKEYSKKLGCGYILVNAIYQNKMAIKLYNKLGFNNFSITMKGKID